MWTESRRRTVLAALGGLVAGSVVTSSLFLMAQADEAGPAADQPLGPTPTGAALPSTSAPGEAVEAEAPGESDDRPIAWTVRDPSVTAPPEQVVSQAAPDAGAESPLRVVSVVNRDGQPQIQVTKVRGTAAAAEAIDRVQDDARAVAVSIDTRVTVASRAPSVVAGPDALRGNQWALDRLGAESTWAEYSTGAGTVVAVIDTGVSGDHPDLAGQLTESGIDYVDAPGDGRTDPNGHGTHVAGIVAAVRDNDIGVAGLAPSARVMPIRALDAAGSGWNSNIAKGIVYATDNGADVVNLSLGGPNQSSAIQTAVNYAMSEGVVVVAAAGNGRAIDNSTTYPAAYPGVLAVASIERDDTSSRFSTTGAFVDVAAPGGRILSTVPTGYGYMSGTSMATPYVAAIAALAADVTGGTLTTEQFERRLTDSAWDLGAPGWDQEFGFGLTDPRGTLCSLTGCVVPAPEPAAPQPPAPQPTGSVTPAPEVTTPSGSPTAPSSPTTAPSATSSPTTSPAPDPSEEPSTAKQTPRLGFTTSGGTVRRGGRVLVALRVTDADTGRPLSDQRVLLRGRRNGAVTFRAWVMSGADGEASVRLRLRRTTRFDLSSPATQDTYAATGPTTIRWRVR